MAADLILNDRPELDAAALNTLATASMTVGVRAPAAAFVHGLGTSTVPEWAPLFGAGIRVSFAGVVQYGAQELLGRLRR